MATPVRKFRADDALWETAQAKTAAAGETVTDVLRDALERYNAGISAEQKPDSVSWVVRYEVRTARGSRRPWAPTETSAMTEDMARKFFRDQKRNPNENVRNFQLVRRADYVVE